MQRNMDTIKFESRHEIEEVFNALETFLKEHPNADEKETIKVLMDKLDVMHMEW